METVIIIFLVIAFFIYLMAQDSNKKTTKERYGDAVGQLATLIADTVGGIARSITESSDSKALRIAREELALRNGDIYRWSTHYFFGDQEKLFVVDDNFRNNLNVLHLSEDAWKMMAKEIFYIGIIRLQSRESHDYSSKKSKHIREDMMTSWSNNNSLKELIDLIKEALDYFHIPYSEWIEYGDVVIEMHNLLENRTIKEFGIIGRIMPMENNLHLL